MSSHLVFINEIYSNADGSIQFIELIAEGSFETQLAGSTLTVTQGSASHTFTFLSNLPNVSTLDKTILIATRGFADLGLVQPDYVIPSSAQFANGFLFTSGTATLSFSGSGDLLTFTNMPTDGARSINVVNGVKVIAQNSPSNFAGDTAIIPSGEPPTLAVALPDLLSGARQAFSFVVPATTFTDADGDNLIYTATLASGKPLPGWLDFDVATRRFSGTPAISDAGVLTIRVSVSDGHGNSASDDFALRVLSGFVLTGGDGADTLTGTGYVDSLSGGGGDDVLGGRGGSDTLVGGHGADRLDGGGATDVLNGGAGADTLIGGDGADTLRGGSENDFYKVTGNDRVIESRDAGHDTISSAVAFALPANVEVLQLTGTSAVRGTGNGLANVLQGNGAANRLDGLGGADRLVGGGGDDTLGGGTGNDTLTGGAGADRFVFDTRLSAAGNVDHVTDFRPGTDRIVLDPALFAGLPADPGASPGFFNSGAGMKSAQDADDRIIYDTSSGLLYYDADGTGTSAGAIRFAQLGADTHPGLSANDIYLLGS